ncbi:MAG: hybrid sensor histidine kinase/response regulator, partial [Deltaproteobacteria bacterium]|nr:hybrid sensor histidine kinase/response regulator [Deltaproteobacteria bacterium]
DNVILADPTQLHQIIMNLCTNAAHAMSKKGGVLTIRVEEAIIEDHKLGLKPGAYVVLTINDTGYGIKSNIMDRIFDPYFTTKGPGEGTGLGLAVVHGIIKSLNGKIKVLSEEGQGTTFSVYLPKYE